jgi:hypothetical protein
VRSCLPSTLVVALLVACAPLPSQRASAPTEAPPSTFPARHYDEVAGAGGPMFAIVPERSVVVIEVHRGGSLARLGHDHVVASHDVRGCIAPAEGRADFYIRLQDLAVDEPSLRAAAGFDTQPTPADVAATRENMLSKVLHADRYPFAEIGIVRIDTVGKAAALEVALTLNGVTRTQRIGAEIEVGADALRVAGQIVVRQSEFGIVPFSILNGAIRVEDPVDVRFDIVARRAIPASVPASHAGACSASVG